MSIAKKMVSSALGTDIDNVTKFSDTKIDPRALKRARGAKEVLFKWSATPTFTYKKLKPRVRKNLVIIGITVGFLLLMMQEFFLIFMVASMFFIAHILSKNPMAEFDYELSNWGLNISGENYLWDDITQYYFSTSAGEERIVFDLKNGLPGRVYASFNPKDKDKIRDVLDTYLPYLEEEPVTFFDRAYNSLIDKFDLQEEK